MGLAMSMNVNSRHYALTAWHAGIKCYLKVMCKTIVPVYPKKLEYLEDIVR